MAKKETPPTSRDRGVVSGRESGVVVDECSADGRGRGWSGLQTVVVMVGAVCRRSWLERSADGRGRGWSALQTVMVVVGAVCKRSWSWLERSAVLWRASLVPEQPGSWAVDFGSWVQVPPWWFGSV